jgi:hypothetical protein
MYFTVSLRIIRKSGALNTVGIACIIYNHRFTYDATFWQRLYTSRYYSSCYGIVLVQKMHIKFVLEKAIKLT